MSNLPPLRRFVALAVPYATVPVGLHVFSSGWAAMGLYHAAMVIVALWVGGDPGWFRRLAHRLGSGWNLPMAGVGLTLCLGSGVALYFLWPLLERLAGASGAAAALGTQLDRLALTGGSWLAFMAYYTLVNPILEEAYWRGVLGSEDSKPTLSDVCFGGYHVLVLAVLLPGRAAVAWTLAIAMGISLMGAGWIWRQIARRHGGLLIPVLTHLAADLSVITAGHLLARAQIG